MVTLGHLKLFSDTREIGATSKSACTCRCVYDRRAEAASASNACHRAPLRRPCPPTPRVSAITKAESREREIEGGEPRADACRLQAY